jgi:hypothetical protein
VDAGDGHRQQQQRDAVRRSRRHWCSLADWFLDWFFLRRCFVVGCGGFIALERRRCTAMVCSWDGDCCELGPAGIWKLA